MVSYNEARAAWGRRFDLPLEDLLPVWIAHVEGGIADDPRDPGRLTVYGLASATHPWVTRETTWEEAWSRGYLPLYVEALSIREMPASFGFMCFSLAVQHEEGVQIFQRALGVEPDGIVGPATVAATFRRRGPASIVAMHTARIRYVTGLKIWPTFGRTWMLRYADALEVALALMGYFKPEETTP